MNPADEPLINSLTEVEVLALTIAGEAEGEPVEGQIGVGLVILKRSQAWKISVTEVCLQKDAFSCWLSISSKVDYDRIIGYAKELTYNNTPNELKQVLWVAQGIIEDKFKDNTNNALYYITQDLYLKEQSKYSKYAPFTKLGHQLFYHG